MKTKHIKGALLLMLMGVSAAVQGQTVQDILSKMNLWQQKHPGEIVYLVSDRSVYAPGERIWFSASVIADIREQRLSKELYVGLVDPYGTEVAVAKFRVMDNQVKGDLDIPAETAPGHYLLMAYSGWMQNASAAQVFTREVRISRNAAPFSVQLKPLDGKYVPGSRVTTDIVCISSRNKPMEVPFRYTLKSDGNSLIQGNGKTNSEGKAVLQFTLPGQISGDTRLQVEISKEGYTAGSTVVIPTAGNEVQVAFFPEGGSLVAGIRRKIAFRAYNAFGRPVKIEGEIHDSKGVAGKVASDEDGLGTFFLTPDEEQSYCMKITAPAGIADTFPLPDPKRSGVVLSLKSRLPESLTLQFEQVNKRIQNYHFIAQMKGKVYWMESRRVNTITDITLPLGDFPAGITEVAVFDSALTPVASRLFFVNSARRLTIEVIPDKPAYGGKEKIGLTIKTFDEHGKPVPAKVSLSAMAPAATGSTGEPGLFAWSALMADLAGYVPLPDGWSGRTPGEDGRFDDLLITAKYSRFEWTRLLRIDDRVPADQYPDSTGNTEWLNFNLQAVVQAKNKLALETIPGIPNVLQAQNDPASWGSAGGGTVPSDLYNGRLTLQEIIYQIRPYTVTNGMVYFDNSAIGSLSYQGGAIIVVDGKLMGTDITALNGILPTDVDHVNVSTRSADIQKYTSLNSMGVIEVYTKVNNQYKKSAEIEKPNPIKDFRQASVFDARAVKKQSYPGAPVTLFWQPLIATDATGSARIEFLNAKKAAEFGVFVEGMSESGLAGSQMLILAPQ